jgi:NAD/NADP transhydrogenase alpha subunit
MCIETQAGAASYLADAAFDADAIAASAAEVFASAQVILTVQPPSLDDIHAMTPGTVLVGALSPYASRERINALNARRITAFATELIPRISRAQSMDTLSSQAAVAGYLTVLIAANHCPKFFPMLTYAAGTIRPARVLVIGAGVAGLQAIATAKRLGAVVEGYDVRPETREQIESLGAKFVDTGVSAAGTGGYARELTEEEKAQMANAMINPDHRVADFINNIIFLKDIYIEQIQMPNQKTGELQDLPRIVLFDKDGKAYGATSFGIFSALRKIADVYGDPRTWTKPLAVKDKQKTIGENKMLTLEIVSDKQ